MQLALEFGVGFDDIQPMSKEQAKTPRKGSYAVAGVTRDGVSILKVGRATHFSDRQAREAVAKVRSLAASVLTQANARSK